MDVSIAWNPNGSVDELINAINHLKTQLRMCAFSMHGTAKVIEYDVYASGRNIDRLRKSELWKDVERENVEQQNAFARNRQIEVSTPVSDFGFFKLHSDVIMSDNNMRAVITVDTGSGRPATYYGNILIE